MSSTVIVRITPHLESVVWEIPSDAFFAGIIIVISVIVGAAVLFLVVQFALSWRPAQRTRLVNRHALRLNLIVPDELRPALERHVAIRLRGGILGGLAGFCTVLALTRLWEYPPPIELGLAAAPISLGVVLVSTQLGAIVGGLLARRTHDTTTRVARLQPVGIAELVAPVERRMTMVAVMVGVLLPALLLVIVSWPATPAPPHRVDTAPALLLLGLAAAVLHLALPLLARHLVTHRALRGDRAALAWSDALAAQSLRDMHWAVASIGGLAAFVALQSLGTAFPASWDTATMIWINVSAYLCFIAFAVVLVVVLARSPERHVQRTLWPEFAIDAQ